MINPIQCTVTYPGLVALTGNANVTLSHGVRPSTFTIETAINPSSVPPIGTLSLIQNGRVGLQFQNCAVEGVMRSSGPETRFMFQIMDRRWRWVKGGSVATWKSETTSARQLAMMCLNQLGETAYDISMLSTDNRKGFAPDVDWDHIPTVQALDDLLGKIGYRVVLTAYDQIRILPLGYGLSPPRTATVVSSPESIQNFASPDGIIFVGGPTKFQGHLALHPVGEDLDGELKHPDLLSYRPAQGWTAFSPRHPDRAVVFGGGDVAMREKAMALAKKTVWKAFKVVGQADVRYRNTNTIPGHSGNVLPKDYVLLSELESDYTHIGSSQTFTGPVVTGQWADPINGNRPANSVYTNDFRLDTKKGLVYFSEPMYLTQGSKYDSPKLCLYCAYNIKDSQTGQEQRYSQVFPFGMRGGGGLAPVVVSDVTRVVRISAQANGNGDYTVTGVQANDPVVTTAAQYYASSRSAELMPRAGADVTYAGFEAISPDGNIQQVSWTLQNGVGYTRASSGTEHSSIVPKYDHRAKVTFIELMKSKEASKKKESA